MFLHKYRLQIAANVKSEVIDGNVEEIEMIKRYLSRDEHKLTE